MPDHGFLSKGTNHWAGEITNYVGAAGIEELKPMLERIHTRYCEESYHLHLKKFEEFAENFIHPNSINRLAALKLVLANGGNKANSLNTLLLYELLMAVQCTPFVIKDHLQGIKDLKSNLRIGVKSIYQQDLTGRQVVNERKVALAQEIQKKYSVLDDSALFDDVKIAQNYKKNHENTLVFSIEKKQSPHSLEWSVKEHDAQKDPLLLPLDAGALLLLNRCIQKFPATGTPVYKDLLEMCHKQAKAKYSKCKTVDRFDHESSSYPADCYIISKIANDWQIYYINAIKKPLAINKNDAVAAYAELEKINVTMPEKLSVNQLRSITKLLWGFIPTVRLETKRIKALEFGLPSSKSNFNSRKYSYFAVNELAGERLSYQLILTKKDAKWQLHVTGQKGISRLIEETQWKLSPVQRLLSQWDIDPTKQWDNSQPELGCEPEKLTVIDLNEFAVALGDVDFSERLNMGRFDCIERLFGVRKAPPVITRQEAPTNSPTP